MRGRRNVDILLGVGLLVQSGNDRYALLNRLGEVDSDGGIESGVYHTFVCPCHQAPLLLADAEPEVLGDGQRLLHVTGGDCLTNEVGLFDGLAVLLHATFPHSFSTLSAKCVIFGNFIVAHRATLRQSEDTAFTDY